MINTLEQNDRIRWIDIAKGICIISVMIGHLGNASIIHFVYTYHLPMFLMISGAFISKKQSISTFIKHRMRQLLVPYMLTSLLIILEKVVLGYFKGGSLYARKRLVQWIIAAIYGAGDEVLTPNGIKAIGAIWFLWALFWASSIFRILIDAHKYVRLGVALVLFLIGYATSSIFFLPFSIQPGLCSIIFLYIGWIVKQNADRFDLFKRWNWGGISEASLLFLCCCGGMWIQFVRHFKAFYLSHCDFGNGCVDIVSSCCACVIVAIFSIFLVGRFKWVENYLAWMGRYSLLVLCIHIIELDCFPWYDVVDYLVARGMPDMMELPFLVIGKLMVSIAAYALLKFAFVRRIFMYRS